MLSLRKLSGILGLGLLAGLGLALSIPGIGWAAGAEPALLERYPPPPDLEVRCRRLPDPPGGNFYRLEGELTLLIGRTRSIRPLIVVSPDLKLIASLPSTLEISSGRTLRLPFIVRRGPLPSSVALGSVSGRPTSLSAHDTWIRVGVEYLPDYEAIRAEIRQNRRRYPDPRLRHRPWAG